MRGQKVSLKLSWLKRVEYIFSGCGAGNRQTLLYPMAVLNNARRSLAEELEKASLKESSKPKAFKRPDINDIVQLLVKPFEGKETGLHI